MDHDRLFKELLTTFFVEFIELFFPHVAAETTVYNRELKAVEPRERERVMQWTNEWIEKGFADGLVKGRVEGQVEVVLRPLRRRVGQLPLELPDRIHQLSGDQVDAIAEALLDFRSLADVQAWLEHVSPRS